MCTMWFYLGTAPKACHTAKEATGRCITRGSHYVGISPLKDKIYLAVAYGPAGMEKN